MTIYFVKINNHRSSRLRTLHFDGITFRCWIASASYVGACKKKKKIGTNWSCHNFPFDFVKNRLVSMRASSLQSTSI